VSYRQDPNHRVRVITGELLCLTAFSIAPVPSSVSKSSIFSGNFQELSRRIELLIERKVGNNVRETKRKMKQNIQDKGRGSPQKQGTFARQIIATFVAITVWFSFNLGGSLQAAQNDLTIGAAPETAFATPSQPSNATFSETLMSNAPEIAIVAVSLISFVLLGHNLAAFGKRGWGWMTLCIIAALGAMFGKMIVAMFQEVSAANSIADWDSD
jgi:hypothetical protein